jgi:alpha,alpha-trehalase
MSNPKLFFIESLSPLYEAVQSAGIFTDSKFFVDAVPVHPLPVITAQYTSQNNDPAFNLKEFVTANFILPEKKKSSYSSAKKTIDTHLNDLWEELKRMPDASGGTLIPLPHAYIVPGGRFREIYYWDSYFTMLGLLVCKKTEQIEHMVDNFAYLINKLGFIPNGNRTYYLGRSQPPFFALMVNLLSEEKGIATVLKYQAVLEKEYHFWMYGAEELNHRQTAIEHVVRLADNIVMNRYWDAKADPRPEAYVEDKHIAAASSNAPEIVYRHIRAAAESGWDFSSRWFKDGKEMATIQTTDLIPVDLNCLLLYLEETLQSIYQQQNDTENVKQLQTKINSRKAAIQQYCWNEEQGCYFDFNCVEQQQIQHFNLATVFPLFFNIATQEQAAKVAMLIKEKFVCPGGVVTTLYRTGQQWDAPNGWAPLQWVAYKGLKNYGFTELANQIKSNWLSNCEKVFTETGKMMEKYNVMDITVTAGGGEYPNQDGFGWTNGVYLKMKAEQD